MPRPAHRWMVQRVIDYGWTAKHFGRFDETIRHGRYEGRTGHKAERIGKKYNHPLQGWDSRLV